MNSVLFLIISSAAAYTSYYYSPIASAAPSSDSISGSQSLVDNGETLVSAGGKFELGFFSPGNSNKRYLGVWYKNIPLRTVVWVANRESPIQDSSGKLTVSAAGAAVLSSGRNSQIVWSANRTAAAAQSPPLLQILDSGNLVLKADSSSPDVYLWQSFDYPSDTLLPGMKLGWDLRTSLNRRLTSWKSADDPSPGELTSGVELNPYPQVAMYKGSKKYFRGGPWNGLRFSGAPELKENPMFSFDFISDEEEVYYTFELKSETVISRFVLNQTTSTRDRYVWVEGDNAWKLFSSVPRDYCDSYGLCGANGLCKITDSPVCQCLRGFKPRLSQNWAAMDWSGGCVRDEPLNCSKRHGFVKFSGLKLPDTYNSWMNESMGIGECREACLRNCSCTAYANSDIRGKGRGCALWFDDLVDIRQFPEGGQDLYVRMPSKKRAKRSLAIIVAAVITPTALFSVAVILWCIYRRNTKRKGGTHGARRDSLCNTDHDFDLPVYDFHTIALATDDFSDRNKLGEGGFGPVYKGSLNDGQTVAVKRLSNNSGQGLEEFKNEVKLIARLQHRNLVKLVGCCIEGDEKMLIYECMPNGSLSSFIFDERRKTELSWAKRFNIICGVARGLLYLHQDSRLRIIHRDLKASNVLLDGDMNPKISDFGMARIFGGDDRVEESTRRIVGTYGYMAPEYAFYGLFSVKSDVFSFGVLLLEILSGKKNRGFEDDLNNFLSLIGYAWKLWTESRPLDMIELKLNDGTKNNLQTTQQQEMARCIHVGLLCIQQNPEDRPSMAAVVIMLSGDGVLPQPKQPGFLIDSIPVDARSSSSHRDFLSINDYSITMLDGR